ncbi:MAG TPA: ATP-binding protein [Polyangia bacterium]|jgi:two-component system sensor histidine kinase ChvG
MSGAGPLWRLPRWLFRIRTRLLLVNAVIVSVPVFGLAFARFYEREMLGAVETDMIHQADVLRVLLREDAAAGPEALAKRGPMLTAIAARTRTRIRLVVPPGRVVADSHANGPPEGVERAPALAGPRLSGAPPEKAGRHASRAADGDAAPEPDFGVADRPEIKRVLAGKYGAMTRVWRWPRYLSGAVEGERVYLFSALPLARPDGTIAGAVYMTRSTVPVLASMHRLRSALVKILLVVLAITAVLSLFLAATIARPLGNLLRRAHRVAAGSRGESLRLDRRDEIGDLARALDEMARGLDARADATAALAADISHEFKSPLTSLRGAAELLLDSAGDDPAARQRFLANMLADTQRLDRLVTRLLELSRLEADSAPPVELDAAEVVGEAVASCAGHAPVNWRPPAVRVPLRGRRPALVAAVRNLVDNAQAHAAANTAVAVRLHSSGADVVLSVRNRGAAIPPATLERMWDRFFTTRADRGGTGLGLPIVMAAARAHGGRVTCASSTAEGTTFVLTLPGAAVG